MRRRTLLLALMLFTGAVAHAQRPFDPFVQARIDRRPGAQIPMDAPLTDERGQPTTLRRIAAGRPLLLAPVLHRCPNLCDVTLTGLSRAIAGQSLKPGPDFALVAFGIDPKESATDAAGNLARLRGHAPAAVVRAMSASVGSARAVTDALGYHYAWDPRAGQYAHAAAVAALTPDGRLSSWIYGLTPSPDAVQRAVEGTRGDASPGWAEPLLLLCYHFDPVTGRYTLAIEKVLRWAALLTVAALVLLVLRLHRRPA